MSFGQVFYVYWSTLCRLVNFMSFGQVLYVVWSTLCRLVKFYMSTGQLNVVWSSFICLLVNFHIRSRKADLPFAIRARKRELRLQRYVSRMTRTENLLSQNFSKFFWKLLLFMFHATLIIMSRKYFFRFSKVTHTLRYTILDSRAPLVMRSRKAGLPFAIRARKLRKLGSSAFRGTYRECTYNRNSRKAVNLISFIYLILVENVTFGPQILWKICKLGPQI